MKILDIITKFEQATEFKAINEFEELGEAKPAVICKSKLDVSELTFDYVIANMPEIEKNYNYWIWNVFNCLYKHLFRYTG